jgi:hypothetical protein
MRKRTNRFSSLLLILLIFSSFIFAEESKRHKIGGILIEARQRQNRGNPEFNDVMLEKLVKYQPDTGDELLEKKN